MNRFKLLLSVWELAQDMLYGMNRFKLLLSVWELAQEGNP